ncbi:MAG: hypothetical protein LQ346_003101 [Caloplaca aetnensis]|nr:MAG: hypothetical protein LQ346_003101 [Caloplaca aetnensis]
MAGHASFQYDALHLPTQIRLVELLPSEAVQDRISCRVRIVDLDESPVYEAISYVWGNEEDQAEILCEGVPLQVPRNLIAALRRFRRCATPRLLWADSICINQAKVVEKNHQVGIMGRIYKSSATVLIWLGQAEDEEPMLVARCIETLCCLYSSGRLEELGRDLTAPTTRFENVATIYDEINAVFDTPAGSSSLFQALTRFLTSPWYSRAWTFQESFLAQERTFFYGCLEILGNRLQMAVCCLQKLYMAIGTPIHISMRSKPDLLRSISMLSAENTPKHTTFRHLMSMRCGSGCKHAVDLVYSLLAVTTDAVSLVPDYDKDFPQVFAEAMLSIMRIEEHLAILGEVDAVSRSTTSDLPSWMPDWRTMKTYHGVLTYGSHLISCAGTTKPIASISSNARNLKISGFLIDSVGKSVLSTEALGRTEGEEDTFVDTVRILSCDLAVFRSESESNVKRWDQSTYDPFHAFMVEQGSYEPTPAVHAFLNRIVSAVGESRFMLTRCQRKGLAPVNVEQDDLVAVLFGGRVPVLLRPAAKKNEFLFVGQCYVDQMMDGQAMEQLAKAQSGIATDMAELACFNGPDLQLYQTRDFVLV